MTDSKMSFELDYDISKSLYEKWQKIITESPLPKNGLIELSVYHTRENGKNTIGIHEFSDRKNSIIQFSPVKKGDFYNRLTNIMASDGSYVLVRQGWLHKNYISDPIKDGLENKTSQDFRDATGLFPVDFEVETLRPIFENILIAQGKTGDIIERTVRERLKLASRRRWYAVANLSAPEDEILRQTADFAHACAQGRARFASAGIAQTLPPESERSENAQPFERGATAAKDSRIIDPIHAKIWCDLKKLIENLGGKTSKSRAGRYEIDLAAIISDGRKLLFEIKSGCSAGEIQQGVGQLMLYRELSTGFARHTPVLLLGGNPPIDVAAAVDRLGIALHTCTPPSETDGSTFFSPEFEAYLRGA